MNIAENNRSEHETWASLMACKDPKLLWEKIDWSGKVKGNTVEADATVNEFADFLEKRCSLPADHSTYTDIRTDVSNPTLDARISEAEVLDAAKRMKSSSKARCGIPVPVFMLVVMSILSLLTNVFNQILSCMHRDGSFKA